MNVESLTTVSRHLGDLRERVVFVGGMIRGLLVTDPAAGPPRATKDVDVIVDVPSRVALIELNEQLRASGFREANEEGAPLCRWIVEDVRVDVMPIDPALLGFSNVWYPAGLAAATTVEGFAGAIRVISAPYFCGTKIEAFASRGEGDMYHHDLEDVIALVDGRPTLVTEITSAPEDLRTYLARAVGKLLQMAAFVEALPGHLAGDSASQGRLPLILQRLRAIAALGGTSTTPPAPRQPRISSVPALGLPLPSRTILQSSNIYSAAYNRATQILTIEFHSGTAYEYSGVPETIYRGLLDAASAGRYHHQWIKRFPYRQLP